MKTAPRPYTQEVETFSDDRGVFVPFLEHADRLEHKQGLRIKRVYYVYDYGKGVVRGLHFHKREWKFFIVVSGAAKIVAVNPKHPKEKYEFVSSARKSALVIIPPGFANGWMSLEENTILLCCSTATTKESLLDDKRYNPRKWGDVWQVKER